MLASLKRWTVGPLILGTLFLASCTPKPTPPPTQSWVRPITFHKETLDWLIRHPEPIPRQAVYDLDQINKHNEKYRRLILGQNE